MKPNDNERLFREAAQYYVDADGEKLRHEMRALEQSGFSYTLPRADAAMAPLIKKRKRRTWVVTVAAAAAIVILALPVFLQNKTNGPTNEEDPSAVVELIPLGFQLPENLAVANTQVDQGESIYHLTDEYLDDVVLTMQYGEIQNSADMRAISIDGQPAYFMITDRYNLLLFEKDGIIYKLTCRYDINTLFSLGRAIL